MCFSSLFSGVFLNVIRCSKRMEILLYSVSFCRLKEKINSFLLISIFSTFLTRQRKNIISCILTSSTHQVELFLLIFL